MHSRDETPAAPLTDGPEQAESGGPAPCPEAPRERSRLELPARVRRRDGSLVPFDPSRITDAIFRAASEGGMPDRRSAQKLAGHVIAHLRGGGATPSVEEIQDAVEHVLMEGGFDQLARRYVMYRGHRAELRAAKRMLGVRDELKLSAAAAAVLRERYLRRNDAGEIVESSGEMMERVASHAAKAEERFTAGSCAGLTRRFASLMRSLEFLPNSPTLMNAGTDIGVLSGCFVLPVEDSLSSIFDAVKQMALIHQAGGGTGFSFSQLRPKGDLVRSTHRSASGPVSFMQIFDCATAVVKEGGRRRGANIAVLDVSHPDIERFVRAKAGSTALQNFNLSVAVSDEFMRACEADRMHTLINPRTGQPAGELPARRLFDLIAAEAWQSGDPGLLFLDRINEDNPVPGLGRIEATNPCGEVPLLPYESCNLGSVNLARMLRGGEIDWGRLRTVVHLAVRFLDDVIDVSRFVTPEVDEATRRTRKIGLGVMGLAELLALAGVPYDSERALELAGRIAATIRDEAERASRQLALQRGPFPAWALSRAAEQQEAARRNAQLISIAPTGTVSILAGTTAGIEPMFAISYVRNVLGRQLLESNAAFERIARERGFYSEGLMSEIASAAGVRGNPAVPGDVQKAFVTALEIEPQWHLRMQAAFQEHADGAVSKTVNLPAHATIEEVRQIYLSAWRLRLKGITVYRYGSKAGQVLSLLSPPQTSPRPPVSVDGEYAGGCSGHACEF